MPVLLGYLKMSTCWLCFTLIDNFEILVFSPLEFVTFKGIYSRLLCGDGRQKNISGRHNGKAGSSKDTDRKYARALLTTK